MTDLSYVLLILCGIFFSGLLMFGRDSLKEEKKRREAEERTRAATSRSLESEMEIQRLRNALAQLTKELTEARREKAFDAIGQAATFPDCPRCQSPMRKGKHCPRCGYPAGVEEAKRVRQKPFNPPPNLSGHTTCADCGLPFFPHSASDGRCDVCRTKKRFREEVAPSWFDAGERICLGCGAHNPPDAAFCKDCHTPFITLTRLP